MESVKEKGAKGNSFEGSLEARDRLGAIKPEKEAPEAVKEKPKAKAKAEKVEPRAAKEKQIRKAKFSVAIAPSDLALLRKAAKKAGKSVSLFAAECVMERVR